MIFIISKLQRADNTLFEQHKEEIGLYYYQAAKYYLQSGSVEEAKKYTELALQLNPGDIDSLSLFTELMINTNNINLLLTVLKNAFKFKPCFEIARMYADSVNDNAEEIYSMLASIAPIQKYPELFLALSAYLSLPDKVIEFKNNNKLLPYNPA
jgi:tetratricopeptide (TPR) repeat protein